MPMLRWLFVVLIFSVLSDGLASFAEVTKEAEFVIEGLQKRYDSTVDFVADFRQQSELKTLDRRLEAWGTVYFRRPGRMLWQYDEPKGQLVLADGEHLYYYQPEQKQVIKSRLSKAFRSDTPFSFLLGIGDLKRDFIVTLVGSEEDHYVLQLAPKENLGEIGEFLLGIDSKGFDILWARIEDAVGNVTTISFSRIQRGVGLRDSLFRLRVPDEVDIVELGS